jgi:hypothetical protein
MFLLFLFKLPNARGRQYFRLVQNHLLNLSRGDLRNSHTFGMKTTYEVLYKAS